MIQQPLAVTTALFFSLSLIPHHETKPLNMDIDSITITSDNTPLPVDNNAHKVTESHDWPSESPRSTTGDNESKPEQQPASSGASPGVSVWLKMASDNSRKILQNFGLPSCRITQSEDSHHTQEGWNSFALDYACVQGVSYDVRAPDFKKEYIVAYIGHDSRLWDYIVLRHGDERYVFGHTQTTRKPGQRIEPGDIIGQSNDSGHSKGIHTHAEYWKWSKNMTFDGKRTNEHSQKLCTQREWQFCQAKKVEANTAQVSTKWGGLQKYYFTHYDLGDIYQNDASPCHGASGADLCFLARQWVNTMALTRDIRDKLGVKWGDKVILEWDAWCRWIYEVHDEMNKRYRVVNGWVKRPWTNYYIKGDLPGKPGGACTVQKIKY